MLRSLAFWLALTTLQASVAPSIAADDLEYDQNWRWATFTTRSGLPSDDIVHLVEAANGTPWVMTRKGLAYFDGYRWHAARTPDISSYTPVKALEADPRGGVLVVANGRLYRVSTTSCKGVAIQEDGHDLDVTDVAVLDDERALVRTTDGLRQVGADGVMKFPSPPSSIVQLGRTRTGVVWATTTDGLYELVDGQWHPLFARFATAMRAQPWGAILSTKDTALTAGAWTWLADDPAPPQRLSQQDGQHVTAMDLGPNGSGVVVYAAGQARARHDGRWQWMSTVPEELQHATVLRFRPNGDLWVGTPHGLHLCHRSLNRWTRLGRSGRGGENDVNCLLLTEAGDLWVATADGLLIYHADGSVETITEILDRPLGVVTGLAMDRDDAIWVSSGASFDGAFRFDGVSWRHFGARDGLHAPRVHRIERDRQGRLWFLGLTINFGVGQAAAYVLDDGSFERWGSDEGLLGGRVYAFAEGAGGVLWFGTQSGLSRYDESGWRHWTMENGLRNPRIFTLAIGDEERVWFGHHLSDGLGHINPDGSVEYLDVADGLVNPAVRELKFDDTGGLWIATENGLGLLQDGVFSAFHRRVGLDFPYTWPILPAGDRVYVGTIGGGVYVLNREADIGPPPRLTIATPLIDRGTALLRWEAFAYGGLITPELIETRFRIDDSTWSPWSRSRETTAIALPPGDHRLEVQAKGLFGMVNAGASGITFNVAPPFYRRPLFVAVFAGWLVSMVLLGIWQLARRRRHRLALSAREQHFRSLIEEGSDLIGVLDSDGVVTYISPSVRRVLGIEPESLIGRPIIDLVHRDDRETFEGVFASPRWARAVRLHNADGDWAVLDITARVITVDNRTQRILNCHDITARHLAESALRESGERLAKMVDVQRILLKELDHRVRNNLASLLALIELTRKAARDVDEFASSITARTRTMAATHDVLSGGQWRPIPMDRLIRALLPSELPGRLELHGVAIEIAPAKAQALGMVISELIANSIKYGAINVPGGLVNVSWTTTDDQRRIELRWVESGGPPIETTPTPGVGTSLVEGLARSELRGHATLEFPRDGATYVLNLLIADDTEEPATYQTVGSHR